MRKAFLTSFLLLPFVACSSEPAQDASVSLQAPLGLEQASLVAPLVDNPLTAEKATLGKHLFFDPRLSASGKMGCVNCHYPDKAFTDGLALSTKDNGGKNSRNSPTMYNVGYYPELYWDGRKTGLEDNILAAWTGQLAGKPDEVAKALNGVAGYQKMFQAAFGGEATQDRIVQALAAFLRTLRSGNSAYDRYVAGDKQALSAAAQAGLQVFQGKGGCVLCHTPPLFTDKLYHNVGIGMAAEKPDLGRAAATKSDADNGKFKTPTLREVAKTGPWFHDGSVTTLRETVKIMASGGIDNPNKDPLLLDRGLTDEEMDQLVAFLESLSGDVPFTAPKLPQ